MRAAALVQADATPAVIGSLAALLNDPEPRVVREAAQALRRVGLEGARTMIAGLSRLDWYARRYCVEELSTWADAVPLLIEASRGPEALVRWCAVEALRHLDESAASAALAALRGEESDARVRELLGGSARQHS
jgi:HEAT repeat protein